MRSILPILMPLAAAALLGAACGKSNDEAAPAPVSTTTTTTTTASAGNVTAKATEIYQQRCVACHGEKGLGDGPASAGLTPRPRAFSDHDWQQSVDDAYIQQIIQFGGTAVGKSAAMPGNPDLKDEAIVIALKDVVRKFGAH
jgi:mono/diheme cytochrome c family protein